MKLRILFPLVFIAWSLHTHAAGKKVDVAETLNFKIGNYKKVTGPDDSCQSDTVIPLEYSNQGEEVTLTFGPKWTFPHLQEKKFAEPSLQGCRLKTETVIKNFRLEQTTINTCTKKSDNYERKMEVTQQGDRLKIQFRYIGSHKSQFVCEFAAVSQKERP